MAYPTTYSLALEKGGSICSATGGQFRALRLRNMKRVAMVNLGSISNQV